MTQQTALQALPPDAVWSSSFGNPGEAGFSEYYRTPDGRRFELSNGRSWMDFAPFDWTLTQVD